MLPLESSVHRHILSSRSIECQLGEDLVTLCMDYIAALRANPRIYKHRTSTLTAIFGLLVRAVRTFRALILLEERGFRPEAEVLSRTLFEISIALRFITRSRLRLDRDQPWLSMEERANRYLAHYELDLQAGAQQHAATPGLRREAKRFNHTRLHARATAARDAVGAVADKLSRGRYAGVPFRELCRAVGAKTEYASIYKPLSWAAHGTDAGSFAFFDGNQLNVRLAPESNQLVSFFPTAVALCATGYISVDRKFGGMFKEQFTAIVKRTRELRKTA